MDSDDANPFLSCIGEKFYEIKKSFKTKIMRFGFIFDEDIFSDTLLKYNDTLSKRSLGKNRMLFYFWTAFKNNTLRNLNYSRNKLRSEFPEDVADEIDFETITEDFEKISRMIVLEFGEEMYEYFVLHANGMSYENLLKMSNVDNLKYRFRRIREFVRHNFSRED